MMVHIWPLIILTLIGALLGLALALGSKYLAVKEDKRIDDIEKLLPGVNCGACGTAGCREFATQVLSGEIKDLNRCKPGNAVKNYQPIFEYLKNHPNEDGTIVDVTYN